MIVVGVVVAVAVAAASAGSAAASAAAASHTVAVVVAAAAVTGNGREARTGCVTTPREGRRTLMWQVASTIMQRYIRVAVRSAVGLVTPHMDRPLEGTSCETTEQWSSGYTKQPTRALGQGIARGKLSILQYVRQPRRHIKRGRWCTNVPFTIGR